MKRLYYTRVNRVNFAALFSAVLLLGFLFSSCNPPTSTSIEKIAEKSPPTPPAVPSPNPPVNPVQPVPPAPPGIPGDPEPQEPPDVRPSASYTTTVKGRLTLIGPGAPSAADAGISGVTITSSSGDSVQTGDNGNFTLAVTHHGEEGSFDVNVALTNGYAGGYKADTDLDTETARRIARSSGSETVTVNFTLAYGHKTTLKSTLTRRDTDNPSNTWGISIPNAVISVSALPGIELPVGITDSAGHIKGPDRGGGRGRVSGFDVYHAGAFRLIAAVDDTTHSSGIIETREDRYEPSKLEMTEQEDEDSRDS